MLKSVNINAKFEAIKETWSPKMVASVNEFAVKAVKLDGEFIWHHHDDDDELFFVMRGRVDMHYRLGGVEHIEPICEGEMLTVPRGVEHKPVAAAGTELLLIERAGLLNTGNVTDSERRKEAQPI